MAKLLEVSNLKTQFFTQDGIVHAVNGISYQVGQGETLAIVGESGSGKSVGVMSLIRLIPEPPGKIVDGQVMFDGQDLLKLSENELRSVRGNRIAMIFQDPMTSLNPVLTIGRQITEAHNELGFQEFLAMLQFGTMPAELSVKNIKLFAAHVLPALQALTDNNYRGFELSEQAAE